MLWDASAAKSHQKFKSQVRDPQSENPRTANKSAASAASPSYVKFRAVIKLTACAASLRGGRTSGRLDPGFFFAIVGRADGQQIVKISDSEIRLATSTASQGSLLQQPT